MGLNPIKGLNKMLKGKNLAMKILAAFIVFWLFSLVLNVLNIQTEGFKVGGGVGGNMLVYFYMNGCPHCDRFSPEWDKFSKGAKIKTKKVEAGEMSPEHQKLGIDGFPTVMLLGPKGPKKYTGERTAGALNKFISSL